jgi:phosphonopyruvate decarboxylase
MDLAGVAVSCGYGSVARITTSEELETLLKDRTPGLRFVSLKTRPGVPADLPRPTVTPREVARRITETLGRTA